jgi:hypothetical protein
LTGSIRNFVVLVAVALFLLGGGATGTQDEFELMGCCIQEAVSSDIGLVREATFADGSIVLLTANIDNVYALSQRNHLVFLSQPSSYLRLTPRLILL